MGTWRRVVSSLQVMELCGDRRGELLEHTMLAGVGAAAGGDGGAEADGGRCLLRYVLPLSELAGHLYSDLKARTQG